MIMNNPNPNMLPTHLHHDQHQNNSYFLSKYDDQQSKTSKQESKLR